MTTDARRDALARSRFVLSEEQAIAVADKMSAANGTWRYEYPWEALAQDVERQDGSRFLLLGYGSLVNRSSAGRTLSEDTGVAAVAFGVRRVFNYVIPDDNVRYGRLQAPAERAALNVVPTGRVADAVNGVVFRVSLQDIPALRAREVGYDLVRVVCVHWYEREQPPFFAYVLHCPDEPRAGKVRTARDILPHPVYYRVCRRGAGEIGEDFLRFWLATTYLADGTTAVERWEPAVVREPDD